MAMFFAQMLEAGSAKKSRIGLPRHQIGLIV
jgi:hypothetical protein